MYLQFIGEEYSEVLHRHVYLSPGDENVKVSREEIAEQVRKSILQGDDFYFSSSTMNVMIVKGEVKAYIRDKEERCDAGEKEVS